MASALLHYSRPLLQQAQKPSPDPLSSRHRKFQAISLLRFNPLIGAGPRPKHVSLTLSPASRLSFAIKPIAASSRPAAPTQPHGAKLSDSIRTITSVLALALGASLSIAKLVQKLPADKVLACVSKLRTSPQDVVAIRELGGSLSSTAAPLFFAALRDRPSGYLNTPLTVVAAGLSKWLDIYSGVLMVRVLLSWFPNIPWERQPLSAIRDLCDPYLNLFRNIIPPIFDTLDVSPLLAFAVLGTLGSILNNSRGMY